MERKKILLSIGERDEAFEALYEHLSAVADVTVTNLTDFSLRGFDIFIGKKLGKEKLEEADRLKAVFAYKTGVDDFPLKEFARRGIALSNSHINSTYIAEYAFGLALALVHRTAEFDRRFRSGDWCGRDPYWKSLFSMKVGLVGYGHIGKAIHAILKNNDIEAYTLDRKKKYEGIIAVEGLDRLVEICDMLILSLPKTADTDCMFGERLLKKMKGKYLVNVGRSNCIDEAALYAALKGGTLAGAAIDTWREKPKTPDEKLLPFDVPFEELGSIVLSSHKAMQLLDGHKKYVEDVERHVLEYLKSGAVPDSVNLTLGY